MADGWGTPQPIDTSGGWGAPEPVSAPAPPKPAAQGWGTPEPVQGANGWGAPEPVADPKPTPKTKPAAAAQKPASDSAGRAFKEDVVEPWKRVYHDLTDSHQGEGYFKGLGRSLRGPVDLGRAAVSSLGYLPDQLIARPAADALADNVPAYRIEGGKGTAHLVRRDPGEVSKEVAGDINTAMGAAGSKAGFKEMRSGAVGPAWKMPPKIRAPKVKEPIFADPAGQVRPSEPEKPGPIFGAEAKPTQRLDNALHRVRTRQEARKVQALQNKERTRRAFGDQYDAEGENLSHELEHALVDPKRTLSDRAQNALQFAQKAKARQTDAVNRARRLAGKIGLSDTEFKEYGLDEGYVPRQVKGLSRSLDGPLVDEGRDPISGVGLPLNKSTSALKGRSDWRMLQPVGGKGEPLWVSKEMAKANPGRYDEIGKVVPGSGGQKYRVRQPTMAEVEKHTAGEAEPTVYHKNYFDLIEDAAVRAEQVADNLEVLHASLEDLKGRGLAHREEWMRPETTKDGRTVYVPQRARVDTPEGFQRLPHVPQLKGWAFAPEVAEIFKDYKPPRGADLDHVLRTVNGGLTSSLFWNPIPHSWNVANDWAKARGWDWLPGRGGYASLIRNGAKAVQAVVTKNDLYKHLLNEGASLMSAGNETRNFHELMLNKGVAEISRDRTAMSTIMHAFDLKGLAPQKLIASVYKAASNELWRASDILMTQRILELQDRGMPVRQAISQAEKDIASYRVPSRVLGQRWLSEAIRNPNLQQFGRYHYSIFKGWGTMFRDLYKGSPEERTEAAGKFLAAMIMAHGAYPILDKLAKKVTGDDSARVHRGGAVGLMDATEQLTQGQKDWTAFVGRVLDLPPATRALFEVGSGGRSFPFGQQIMNPQLSPAEQGGQLAEHVGGYLAPVGEAEDAARPGGAKKQLLRQALIDTETEKQQRGKRYAQQRDKKAAKRLRKTDPFVQAAEDLTQ